MIKFKREAHCLIICLVVLAGCREKSESGIPFSDLKLGDEVTNTGLMLQDMSFGLHDVIIENSQLDTVLIAVHGYGSRGYEWVYPLRKMAGSGLKTFYYRWDWTDCPGPASQTLKSLIDSLVFEHNEIKQIRLFGHSYGGVIVTSLADQTFTVSMDIHAIAAPLKGHARLESNCPDYPRFDNLILANTLHQWRTEQEQDGAFKDLPIDPQVIEIPGSRVLELPGTFKDGKRLGHNWSITWVMNRYFKEGE